MNTPSATPQGFGHHAPRLSLPAREAMNAAQQQAADSLINSPRKGVFGPFIPLMQTPHLLEPIGKTGEILRFQGSLPARLRELLICAVARATDNQFEWQTHVPLATQAGIAPSTLQTLGAGSTPRDIPTDEACILDFFQELWQHNGVSDATYTRAVEHFNPQGVVELTALIGYFVMVCWIMNTARTPGPAGNPTPALEPVPA